ncbi:hypothetical protein O181_006758 [Austropuccinia psidii MF-1]|uniref:Uncharacterized protein n=1 Tax=Austropuccinia psidii MF-1 TaxID=1389203 RepID=A0A9Q3BKU2_9BASI|nr:hypothetical protein [Austropuccinia psidii MF-1]
MNILRNLLVAAKNQLCEVFPCYVLHSEERENQIRFHRGTFEYQKQTSKLHRWYEDQSPIQSFDLQGRDDTSPSPDIETQLVSAEVQKALIPVELSAECLASERSRLPSETVEEHRCLVTLLVPKQLDRLFIKGKGGFVSPISPILSHCIKAALTCAPNRITLSPKQHSILAIRKSAIDSQKQSMPSPCYCILIPLLAAPFAIASPINDVKIAALVENNTGNPIATLPTSPTGRMGPTTANSLVDRQELTRSSIESSSAANDTSLDPYASPKYTTLSLDRTEDEKLVPPNTVPTLPDNGTNETSFSNSTALEEVVPKREERHETVNIPSEYTQSSTGLGSETQGDDKRTLGIEVTLLTENPIIGSKENEERNLNLSADSGDERDFHQVELPPKTTEVDGVAQASTQPSDHTTETSPDNTSDHPNASALVQNFEAKEGQPLEDGTLTASALLGKEVQLASEKPIVSAKQDSQAHQDTSDVFNTNSQPPGNFSEETKSQNNLISTTGLVPSYDQKLKPKGFPTVPPTVFLEHPSESPSPKLPSTPVGPASSHQLAVNEITSVLPPPSQKKEQAVTTPLSLVKPSFEVEEAISQAPNVQAVSKEAKPETPKRTLLFIGLGGVGFLTMLSTIIILAKFKKKREITFPSFEKSWKTTRTDIPIGFGASEKAMKITHPIRISPSQAVRGSVPVCLPLRRNDYSDGSFQDPSRLGRTQIYPYPNYNHNPYPENKTYNQKNYDKASCDVSMYDESEFYNNSRYKTTETVQERGRVACFPRRSESNQGFWKEEKSSFP